VEVFDQDQDRFVGVGSADADVVEEAVVAQREIAVVVDSVVADSVVGGVEGNSGGLGRLCRLEVSCR
jgi:hypothetical protein